MQKLLLLALVFFAAFGGLGAHAQMLEKITIAGPMASVSHPFFRMVESGALKDTAKTVEFKLWKNPDELRALILSKSVDFVAVPSNVAANLYNKGQDLRLIGISVWGILQIVSRDENIKTIKDLVGKELIVPFRGDMPDILLKEIARKEGLDLTKDIRIKYASTPIDAAQMLILRKADNALLAEPAVSMVLLKSKSFPAKVIAPDLFRTINIQTEWGRVFSAAPRVPQAGLAAVGDKTNELIDKFLSQYAAALKWYKENPKEAGELTHKYLEMLKPAAVENSIAHIQFDLVRAKDAKAQIVDFFKILEKENPKLIGSKLPDDAFYY
ncbi:MAG: ABC transporter substrate-binding protein [Helicobacteraceae bacterium]